MATAAMALGHEYLVLTDHSPRLTVAHGLNRERLEQQLDEIAALNAELAPFRILTGMEVDIFEDGALDADEDMLERLDVVVASVHAKLRMEERAMTERMVMAVASPHVDILGHCTGRLIEQAAPRRASTPSSCSRPAPASTPRWRSTAARSASTHPRPAAARPRHRLPVLDRHRRPRPGPAGVAVPRVRPGRRGRVARRARGQHVAADDLLAWTTTHPRW